MYKSGGSEIEVEEEFDISTQSVMRRLGGVYKIAFLSMIVLLIVSAFSILQVHSGSLEFETEIKEIRYLYKHIIGVILAIINILILSWYWIKLLIDRRKLFSTYPELENELANLESSDYMDKALQIFVYGHHLVAISSLSIVDLYDCQFLETQTLRLSGDMTFFKIKATLNNGKVVKLAIPKLQTNDIEQRLEGLYAYIFEYYGVGW